MKFSIIIPVYNAESYISQCIDSVLNQSYPQFEILLIDDGSTDSSFEICKQYSKKDDRVFAFSQKNGGTSAARNYGLSQSTGDYILFMDNDDFWINDSMLEIINACLSEKQSDILIFNSLIFDDLKHKYLRKIVNLKRNQVLNKSKSEALSLLIKKDVMTRAVWTKAINKQLIEKYNILFPVGMRNEDSDFTGYLIQYADSYDYLNECFYAYRKGHQSAQSVKQVSKETFLDLSRIISTHLDEISQIDDSEFMKVLYSFWTYPFCVWMGMSSFFKEKRIYRKNMKQYSFVINYGDTMVTKMCKLLMSIIGFNNTCNVLSLYFKYKYDYRKEK